MPKKTLTMHIDSEVLDQFKNYCKLNALKLSAKIELLLKQEMENAKNNPTLIQLFEDILEGKKIKRQSQQRDQTHIQYAPKTDIRQIINEVQNRNKIHQEVKQHIVEEKKHQVQGDINKVIEDVKKRSKAPTLDQLRYRKGL